MRQELMHVAPLGAANITALVYLLMTLVIVLIFSPIFLIMADLAPSEETWLAGPFFMIFFLLLYPVMGVVMGWISGLVMSASYNLIVRWTEGLLVEFNGVSSGPVQPGPGT